MLFRNYLVCSLYFAINSTINLVFASSRASRECNGIGNTLKSKGFTYPWWDSNTETSSLQNFENLCPNAVNSNQKASKCCIASFDTRLQKKEMSNALDKWLGAKLSTAAETFKERKIKFDVTFKSLLARAHTSFHAMFERTYGMLYIQHAHVFHALFTTLEKYYDDGRDPLESQLNEFFSILTRKMFEVLNAQYEFDDAYLSCTAIAIGKKQGSDLHRQIVSSLRRSFVATRALAQGLQDSDKILTNMQKLQVTSSDCLIPLSQMLHCPVCVEQRAFKPCSALCTTVTSKCLEMTTPLSKPWVEFISALEGIIDRLLGPYNVEAVVEPIHIKISEAIMNFQESGPDLSQAVFSECGKPKLRSRNHRKRNASPIPALGKGDHTEDLQPSKSLEKLLRETKNKIRKSKSLWEVIPKQVCSSISKDYSSQLCWNGTSTMKPEKTKGNEETSEINKLPIVGRSVPNSLVTEQIIHLQSITDKLKSAYNGLDVQWVQEKDEEDFGSGMGSGSGDLPTDLEDDDDDDPSGQIKSKGIGGTNQNQHVTFNSDVNIGRPTRPGNDNFDINHVPTRVLKPSHFENDDEDEDDDNPVNPINVNPINRHEIENGEIDTHNGGIDFGGAVPTQEPPRVKSPSSITTPRSKIVAPLYPGTAVGSGKKENATSKTVAIFKLFTPVFASMLGKLFSFS